MSIGDVLYNAKDHMLYKGVAVIAAGLMAVSCSRGEYQRAAIEPHLLRYANNPGFHKLQNENGASTGKIEVTTINSSGTMIRRITQYDYKGRMVVQVDDIGIDGTFDSATRISYDPKTGRGTKRIDWDNDGDDDRVCTQSPKAGKGWDCHAP
ncbi:hypothetical protein ACFL0W_06815 [Nanoarchaeota archaeon]